jgi:tRNA-Thr(GGU) m(6)t(6)A37 methyltransferase TsaA
VIQFKPIGTIHNTVTEAHHDTPWQTIESDIILEEQWREALDGLEEFSHIWVIFCFDRMTPVTTSHTRPMGRPDLPLVGRFATRSPQRPNPIGIAAVELLYIRGNVLRVRGLDALDGTPVLDLKPYLPQRDALNNVRVSDWAKQYRGTEPSQRE